MVSASPTSGLLVGKLPFVVRYSTTAVLAPEAAEDLVGTLLD